MDIDFNEFKPIFSPNDDICDYYLINQNGDIFSQKSNKFIAHITTESGYEVVTLSTKNGARIQRRVHRLVMTTFNYFPGCENLQVDHLNGVKSENNSKNLEFVTGKENVNRAIENNLRKSWKGDQNPQSKLNESKVKEIVKMALDGYSDEQINLKFPEVTLQSIRLILLGKEWTNIVPKEAIDQIREQRMPTILNDQQKHSICKYYQDNIDSFVPGYGKAKLFVNDALTNSQIEINESTFRMAKRLFYRYQDSEITNQYSY
jgi:hypothetical protein